MLMVVVFALGIAAVPLLGGRLGALGEIRLRGSWLIGLSLGLQLLITTVFELPRTLGSVVHVSSYLLLVGFFVLNRRHLGLRVVFVGLALNMAAIFANGGTMPSLPSAVHAAGLDLGSGFENSAPVAGARLQMLGDIFAVPAGVPFANVFSVGDLLIVAGGIFFVHSACGSRGSRRRTLQPQKVTEQPL